MSWEGMKFREMIEQIIKHKYTKTDAIYNHNIRLIVQAKTLMHVTTKRPTVFILTECLSCVLNILYEMFSI